MRRVHEEASRRIAALDLEGVLVEDKTVMVGLHYRSATDREKARRLLDAVAADLAVRFGLIRAGGRLAFELRPPVPFSKKDVVLRRGRELDLRAAMFVGDDVVDVPGFEALEELAVGGVEIARIAVASSEAPPELIERADRVVQGPEGVVQLLDELL
jgi:trehalose 6-phosphate phosphatase